MNGLLIDVLITALLAATMSLRPTVDESNRLTNRDKNGTVRENGKNGQPQPIKAKEVAAASGWMQEKPGFCFRL